MDIEHQIDRLHGDLNGMSNVLYKAEKRIKDLERGFGNLVSLVNILRSCVDTQINIFEDHQAPK